MTKSIFKNNAPLYWDKGLTVCPINPGTKASGAGWNNLIDQVPSSRNREQMLKDTPDHGIGLLTGKKINDLTAILAVDVDDDAYAEPIKRMIGGFVSGKLGKKGLTIFVQGDPKFKRMAIPTKGDRIVDILSRSICVLPPTIHPDTKNEYTWVGQSLLDCDLGTLPLFTEEKAKVIKAIIDNENHVPLMSGKSTHDAALKLIASISGKFNDKDLVCGCVLALLPEDYAGNTRSEISGMWDSAKEKQMGNAGGTDIVYDPEAGGPVPLGYTDNGYYVFLQPEKKILSVLSPAVLMSEAGLCDLATYNFWTEICPKITGKGVVTGLDAKRIGDMLMQKCRSQGPFSPSRVRGCGIWRDGKIVIQNLRGEIPKSDNFTYIRFEALPEFQTALEIDAQKVLNGFSMFNWTIPNFALLLLGWVAIAPICGALKWRPHVFINGPKSTGKSTIIDGLSELLKPMAIMVDGTSSEAGIRQSIGADSRPVILDEFESDRNLGRMRSVLKLARSASSAKGPIARGTPEGKALQFQLHTTFAFGAIIPIPGTSADASRIVELELAPHNNDLNIKKLIDVFGDYLRERATAWPHQMVSIIEPVLEAIEVFEKAMPSGDLRHNLNLATLLGAAFAALNKRVPSEAEATEWVMENRAIIDHLAQAHEEDDGQDCLNHMLCSRISEHTLGELLTRKTTNHLSSTGIAISDSVSEKQTLANYGIMVQDEGFLVANKHPELSKIFQSTIWADGAWKVPLRRLPGALADDKTRARFSGGRQVRCTFVPWSALEDPAKVSADIVTL